MSRNRALISIIAGFSALGFAIMSIIYWAVLANPPLSFNLGAMDLTLRILLIATIVAFSVYLLFSPESVSKAATKRSTRLTANALVASLIAVGIAIVANIIVESVPTARADWTASQEFSISPQTVKVLEGLQAKNANVKAVGFFIQQNRDQAEKLLEGYKSKTANFTYEFFDPQRDPLQAQRYGVRQDGTVVFDLNNGQKREIANSVSERDFTSAIVRLTQTGTKTVAFLTGHGERDPSSFQQEGYGGARQSLEDNNYRTITWNLTTTPTLTLTDVTVLVIAAPQTPLSARDVQSIQSYLDAGGRALIMLDPFMAAEPQQAQPVLQSLNTILQKYGVAPATGVAIDLSGNIGASQAFIRVNNYPVTEITQDLSRRGAYTLFPVAMAVNPPTSTVAGFSVLPFVRTSSEQDRSWLETNLDSPVVSFDPPGDAAGPVTLAVQVSPEIPDPTIPVTPTNTNTSDTRLVVFGDVDFASNLVLSNQQLAQDYANNNIDLFGNAVSWLAESNELISIRPKQTSQAPTIALDEGQKSMVFTATVLGLPLVVLLLGVFNWWRRR